jgi:hypothetical protein
MGTTRAQRRLGMNMNSIWLEMLFKGDLFVGDAVQKVPGCRPGFVKKCPDGYVPAVPMQRGRDEPMDVQQVKGSARAIEKKALMIIRNRNYAEIRWLRSAIEVFELFLRSVLTGSNPLLMAEAIEKAKKINDKTIINFLHDAPSLESFNTLSG